MSACGVVQGRLGVGWGSTRTSLCTAIFIARILSSTEGSSAWPLKRKQKLRGTCDKCERPTCLRT